VKGTRLSIQRFCEGIINDPVYRANIKVRMNEGTLPHSMEAMIWYYAAGKPAEKIDVTVNDKTAKFAQMTPVQLADYAKSLATRLQEADEAMAMAGQES